MCACACKINDDLATGVLRIIKNKFGEKNNDKK